MKTIKKLQDKAINNGMYLEVKATEEEIAQAVAEGAKLCTNHTNKWLVVYFYTPGKLIPYASQQLVLV